MKAPCEHPPTKNSRTAKEKNSGTNDTDTEQINNITYARHILFSRPILKDEI